jgi:hypothetical protein
MPEKDSLGLLLPLSAVPFERVLLAPAASARGGGGGGAPAAAAVRNGFLAKKRAAGDEEAVAALEAGGEGGRGAVGAGGGDGSGGWQAQLSQLWAWAHTDPALQPLRAQLAAGAPGEGRAALPAAPPPAAILPGVEAALAALRDRAEAGGEQLHVLVCGSLYLVGEVLGKLQQLEAAAAGAAGGNAATAEVCRAAEENVK